MSGAAPIVAIDLGGTRFRVGLVDPQGKIIARLSEETRSEEGPARVVDRIVSAAGALLKKQGLKEPIAVGAGVAGPLDRDGVILAPPNLIGWREVPIREMLAERFPVPVWVGNDATLACLGEHTYGCGRGIDDLIYMTVSTGVGGGVISNGVLLTGWRGLAGEIGHIIIQPNGPRGKCGHAGCLESLVSGTAIARRALEGLGDGTPSALAGLVQGDLPASGGLRAEHVFQAAAAGDGFSKDLVQQVARDLALGIVSLVHIFNPRMFIVGGGVARDWHLLAPAVERTVREHAMAGFLEGLTIVPSPLGDDVGLVGAAALVVREGGAG